MWQGGKLQWWPKQGNGCVRKDESISDLLTGGWWPRLVFDSIGPGLAIGPHSAGEGTQPLSSLFSSYVLFQSFRYEVCTKHLWKFSDWD